MDSKGVYALITLFNLKPIIDSRLIMLRRWYKLKSLKERYLKILKIQAFTKVEENILGENKIISNSKKSEKLKWKKVHNIIPNYININNKVELNYQKLHKLVLLIPKIFFHYHFHCHYPIHSYQHSFFVFPFFSKPPYISLRSMPRSSEFAWRHFRFLKDALHTKT